MARLSTGGAAFGRIVGGERVQHVCGVAVRPDIYLNVGELFMHIYISVCGLGVCMFVRAHLCVCAYGRRVCLMMVLCAPDAKREKVL